MKRVLLTQRVERMAATGERRDALSQEWAALAEACNFLPLPMPNRLSMVQALLAELKPDGILLTGGNSLMPYGGDAPERDEAERFLIGWAQENHVPLLGVCRGMQALLDYFGTPLERVSGHVRVEHPLSNGDTVNSFHDWGAVQCLPPLAPLAWSGDGVLEAGVHEICPWRRGVMDHPVRYLPFREQEIHFIKEVLQI